MARIKGPRKIHRYTAEFKLKAVKLSQIKGVQVQDVAGALDLHPFMLSRWRKEVREGRIRARAAVAPEARRQQEIKQLAHSNANTR
jgi:transposase